MSILYDFLFIDQERVRSLYAQMFDGLHEAMEKIAGKVVSKGSKGQVGGDPFGHASHERKTDVAESVLDRISMHDLLLRDVLGGLSERNMLAPDPANAPVGSIVHLSGSLTLLDVSAMHVLLHTIPKLVDEPATSDFGSLPKGQRKQAAKEMGQNMKKAQVLIEAFTSLMPKVVQFVLDADVVRAWGGVQQENMRAQISSLTLQQGSTLSGQWHLLGVVDSCAASIREAQPPTLPEIFAGIQQPFDIIRAMFARPDDDISVTPILIYRRIGATA